MSPLQPKRSIQIIRSLLTITGMLLYGICYAQSAEQELTWLHEHASVKADSSQVLEKVTALLQSAQQKNNLSLSASLFHVLSNYHKTHNRRDSALHYALQSQEQFLTLDEPLALAELHLDLEHLYKYNTLYSKAMEQDFAALKLYESLKDNAGIARCYTNICDLLYYEDNYQKGVDYCNKAIALQSDIDNADALAISYRYRADNEIGLGEYETALNSIDKAIAILINAGKTRYDIRACYNTRGNTLKYLERYDEALLEYQSVYDLIILENKPEVDLVAPLANIGHVYTILEKYAEAIPIKKQAIDIMNRNGYTQNLWENYEQLSLAYENVGDMESALASFKSFSEKHSTFQRNTIDNLQGELLIKYESNQKDETIENQDKLLLQKEKNQLLTAGIAMLLALMIGGLMYFRKKRNKQNEELLKLNESLDAKNQQNELLLKEIHHRVKNNLAIVQSLLTLQSAKMNDSDGKEAMLASKNRVQSMGILHQRLYQGKNLGAIEMKEYFVNLSKEILDSFGAQERVKIQCLMGELELDIDTALPIGLIVNELLTNALKYAFPQGESGKIIITLERKGSSELQLQVKDNGIGKQEVDTKQTEGFGTQLVQLLTKQLKGTLTEESGDGTSIVIQLKIKKTV
ncbi:MAG: two-component sensor histidine kinase [Flavobacteriales bacterium]|jgi:two-component sensor histidine kinase